MDMFNSLLQNKPFISYVSFIMLYCVAVFFGCTSTGRVGLWFLWFYFFCGFSMGRNQYWAGRVMICVYYMTGTPEGSTESGFMEKSGIEPATPGLQGSAYPLHHGGFSGFL